MTDLPDPPLEFFCAVCGKLACYGYGVSLLKGKVGTWYCREHRPEKRAS